MAEQTRAAQCSTAKLAFFNTEWRIVPFALLVIELALRHSVPDAAACCRRLLSVLTRTQQYGRDGTLG